MITLAPKTEKKDAADHDAGNYDDDDAGNRDDNAGNCDDDNDDDKDDEDDDEDATDAGDSSRSLNIGATLRAKTQLICRD